MGTFTEFYMGLVKFINYKLFSDLGLPYPMAVQDMPIEGETYKTGELRTMQANVRKMFEAGQENEDVDADF